MHINGVHSRLSAQMTESEGRTSARLARVETMLATLLKAAGLEVPPVEQGIPTETAADPESTDTDPAPGREGES